eukprot:gene10315-2908_t
MRRIPADEPEPTVHWAWLPAAASHCAVSAGGALHPLCREVLGAAERHDLAALIAGDEWA